MANKTNHKRGPEHPMWKPDAGYSARHIWIRRHKKKPEKCEQCDSSLPLDWANISGEYLRELDDWIALCRSCHRSFDRKPACPNGHERIETNTFVDERGITKCRVCKNEGWRRRYYEKQGREVPK